MVQVEVLKGVRHSLEVKSWNREQRIILAETEATRRYNRSGNWRMGSLGESGGEGVDNWEVRKETQQEQNLPEKS